MDTLDYVFLTIYALFWLIFWIRTKNKYGIKNIGVLYVLFYMIVAVFAIDYYNFDSSGKGQNYFHGQNLFALLYLFIFLSLFISPLFKINFSDYKLIHPSKRIINIASILIIVFSLTGLIEIYENFSTGFIMLLTDDEYGAELYNELRTGSAFDNRSVAHTVSYLGVLTNIARGIATPFCLYYFSVRNKNLIITIGLVISMIITVLNGISIGSRHAIVTSLMNIIVLFYLMHNFYSSKMKKIVSLGFTVFISVAIAATAAITFSRAQKDDRGVLRFVESYTSQSPMFFGKYAFDSGGVRYGDRTFPLVKSLFTSDVARGYTDRVEKYNHMKINESKFITFVGDYVLDFGPFVAAFLLCLFVFFFRKSLHINDNRISFHHILSLYILLVLLNGYYSYSFCDISGNLQLLVLLLLYFFFKLNATKKQSLCRHTSVDF